jgi:hypothetical protein
MLRTHYALAVFEKLIHCAAHMTHVGKTQGMYIQVGVGAAIYR